MTKPIGRRGLGRAHELADGVEHLAQLKAGAGGEAVVSERKRLGLLLKHMELRGEVLVRGERLAQAHEGAHDVEADFDGAC